MAEPIRTTRLLYWMLVTAEVVVEWWAEESQAALTRNGGVRQSTHLIARFKQFALVVLHERAFSSSYFNSNLVAASKFAHPMQELKRLPAKKTGIGSYYLRRVLIITGIFRRCFGRHFFNWFWLKCLAG